MSHLGEGDFHLAGEHSPGPSLRASLLSGDIFLTWGSETHVFVYICAYQDCVSPVSIFRVCTPVCVKS